MTTICVGIDIGLSGALAVIGPDGLRGVADMPVMLKSAVAKVKNEINPGALNQTLQAWVNGHADEVLLAIERVSSMPGQGVAGMFSMGESLGCVRGVVGARGYPVEWVAPQTWKKHFNLKAPPETEKNKRQALMKELSRAKAINLYPDAPLSRKCDHGRAEAILIARFAWDCLR